MLLKWAFAVFAIKWVDCEFAVKRHARRWRAAGLAAARHAVRWIGSPIQSTMALLGIFFRPPLNLHQNAHLRATARSLPIPVQAQLKRLLFGTRQRSPMRLPVIENAASVAPTDMLQLNSGRVRNWSG